MEIKKDKAIASFRYPFKSGNCNQILLSITKSIFDPHETQYTALVSFKNGNTSGEKNIEAEDFNSLVEKVDSFVKSLG